MSNTDGKDHLATSMLAQAVIDAAIREVDHARMNWVVARQSVIANASKDIGEFPGDASWEYKELVRAVNVYEGSTND